MFLQSIVHQHLKYQEGKQPHDQEGKHRHDEKTKQLMFCLLNTEQYSVPENFGHRTSNLAATASAFPLASIRLCDYSAGNLELWAKHKLTEEYTSQGLPVGSTYIPYQNTRAEQTRLRQMLQTLPKMYDVAFVGTQSLRRWAIINKLRSRGLNVVWIKEFDEARDRKIAASKLLLNVHFCTTFAIYESIRCDRWLFAGHTVVSEDSLFGEDWTEKVNYFHVCPFDKIVETVCTVLQKLAVAPAPDTVLLDEQANEQARERETARRTNFLKEWKKGLGLVEA